jgi:hypothetical protein
MQQTSNARMQTVNTLTVVARMRSVGLAPKHQQANAHHHARHTDMQSMGIERSHSSSCGKGHIELR